MTRRRSRLEVLLGLEPSRYMLVDAVTCADMREAQDSEVEHIRRTANFSGVASLGAHAVTMRKLGCLP